MVQSQNFSKSKSPCGDGKYRHLASLMALLAKFHNKFKIDMKIKYKFDNGRKVSAVISKRKNIHAEFLAHPLVMIRTVEHCKAIFDPIFLDGGSDRSSQHSRNC